MRNNLTPHSSDVTSPVTQSISSPHNRTAGRDYVEHRQIKDIRLLLNTESKESLDELALKNERFFARRFGFIASTQIRQQLIDFQNQYDLTDRQIVWLKYTGFLLVRRNTLQVEKSAIVMLFGYSQAAILSLIFLMCIVNFLFSNKLSPDTGEIMLFTTLLYSAFMWVVDKAFLGPRRCLRDKGII